MPQYNNNMSGILFKNQTPKRNPRSPDMSGNCEIEGTEYEIAGWVVTDRATGERKVDRNGNTMLSLKFTEKETQQPRDADPVGDDDLDDDIPF